MFTQCPNCHQKQALTIEQLRDNRAIVHCSQCGINFDALELIHEADENYEERDDMEIRAIVESLPALPWEKPVSTGHGYWGLGVLLGLLLLSGQAVYFEGRALSQNPKYRPGLENLCQHLGCRLPVYKNLDELTIVHGSFNRSPDQHYEFRVVINNQAAFAQPYPGINLTLLDYTGKPFTQRIFGPRDYLGKNAEPALAADATLDINLKIAATATPIGGYTFDLTD